MARKTKAVKQEPQVDVGAEIFASLRELEKVKGIPVEYMVDRLKQALTNAYRRDREDHRDVPADNVVVDLSEKVSILEPKVPRLSKKVLSSRVLYLFL